MINISEVQVSSFGLSMSREKGNMKIVSQKKEWQASEGRKKNSEIYGKTFLIPLINFVVASSCWYFFSVFSFVAYQVRAGVKL